jgi:uncharacterized protein YwqG
LFSENGFSISSDLILSVIWFVIFGLPAIRYVKCAKFGFGVAGKFFTHEELYGDFSRYMDVLNAMSLPTVRLEKSETKSFNKMGGMPNLPESVEWPTWEGKSHSFLCQLDFSTIPKDIFSHAIPAEGYLFLFYDQTQSDTCKGAWKIVYLPIMDIPAVAREAPVDLKKKKKFKEVYVQLSPDRTYPDPSDERLYALPWTEGEREEYCSTLLGTEDGGEHRLFGHEHQIQESDMAMEAQLEYHGIKPSLQYKANHPEVDALRPGKKDWVLLLQIDSDRDTGMMWGDFGKLYFWIRKDDLKCGNFDDVWMCSQCY